ncbi:GIY-YIG nuclease family protein [Cupriavidus necator]|uniref:GIY-YIG nuclease family protein n=1 Tax=Cupriavidus necator TaxID=106590 RepID=A0A367PTP4_CUPNE|nr:GIY-YIG nuclease family protein [Cupriavidus necator]RCJ10467.1 GIY-YIG nuclease family protein [Cupriavidus necator]
MLLTRPFDAYLLVLILGGLALDPPASSATISRWLSSGISPEVAFAKIPNPGYAKGIIYLIEHTTSKRKYVGLTIVSIEERWRRHIEQAEMARIKNFRSLHAAIRKHGPEQFHISEIDRGTTKAGLESKERQWIAKLDALIPHGFNISPGGGSGGAHGRRITIDGICFPSVRAATEHVAGTRGISLSAAKKRIEKGRLDVRPPSKPGEAITKTPAYKAWSRLAYCVMNPKSKEYIPGVKVHKRWLDFQQFLAEVGQPPMAGMAFARLNKSRGFYPDNCIWMTKSEASMINAKQGKARKKNGEK